MIITAIAAAVAIRAGCDLERPSGEPGCTRAAVDALKLNDQQAIGTHNSYKQAIAPKQMALLRAVDAKQADGLDYAHPPLASQLDAGARQLELDLLSDPQGGRYASPLAMRMAPDLPYDLAPLRAPGMKVMHVQDVDYRSSCPRFTDCLRQIADWSKAHPDHLPILVLLNLKEGGLKVPGAVEAPVFDAAAMDAVDGEIRSVFAERDLITPGGVQGRRQWRKVHLAMDTATSDIRAVEFTPSSDGDSPVLPELLDQIPEGEEIGTVTADGAYDTRRCHTAIIDRQATAIIPIRKNGRPWKEDCPAAIARNETLRATRHYGRAFWKRWTGYHVRSRIEAKMRCLKAFGERIAARDPDRQTAEIQIRVALMNRFSALGTAEIVRVA